MYPVRQKILSIGERTNELVRIYEPIWAIITARQVCLSSVDLPPIFGPVTIRVETFYVVVKKILLL